MDYFESPTEQKKEKLLNVLHHCFEAFDTLKCPLEKAQYRRQKNIQTEITMLHTIISNSESFPKTMEDICR